MTTFPAITSTLSDIALGEFVREKYGLSSQFKCTLFRTGINHTYFISDGKAKYVVRVFCYQWRTPLEIEEELALLTQLKNNSFPVSYPIPDKNNQLIQAVEAPEGTRFLVLFSFAEGKKMRFMTPETCGELGSLMAQYHTQTLNQTLNRIQYLPHNLAVAPYDRLRSFFSGSLPEMEYLNTVGKEIENNWEHLDLTEVPQGVVHLDIWYDNLSVNEQAGITLFDFDNCGNGPLILDVGYFCKQLFFIESDKNEYEQKVGAFLMGYQSVRSLTQSELDLIPQAGAAVFIFYLGVQAQRFDWSNIFLTENYLKMYVGRIKAWLEYH